MKKQIPNLITLGNLLCGVLACRFALLCNIEYAALFILLGIVLDFFDGLAARLLHVSSPLGKELDSLADLVTSGMAPCFILFIYLSVFASCYNVDIHLIKYVAFLLPLFSAYRLAKFNLDTRQSHSFRGLPVPSNALIWVSLGLLYFPTAISNIAVISTEWIGTFLNSLEGLICVLLLELICCWLMVSEVPLFGLKFKNLSWKENKVRFIFLSLAALLLVLFGVASLPMIIIYYILLSLITRKQTLAEE